MRTVSDGAQMTRPGGVGRPPLPRRWSADDGDGLEVCAAACIASSAVSSYAFRVCWSRSGVDSSQLPPCIAANLNEPLTRTNLPKANWRGWQHKCSLSVTVTIGSVNEGLKVVPSGAGHRARQPGQRGAAGGVPGAAGGGAGARPAATGADARARPGRRRACGVAEARGELPCLVVDFIGRTSIYAQSF
jgi:hypothetical protein